ncbi:SDR family NAD(P)-dependent oxidoreductase [Actinotalea sp.]|uniref:SDR family NAD(P)-dependent oxidoreductase n=1 Tax=Actinotalea sp. TaxID=1872145 RepID=UPI0035690AB3
MSDRRPTAVVTGAGRGIGAGLAIGLARRGYDLALLGRTPEHLEAVARQVAEQSDAAVTTVPVDLVDPEAVRAAAARVERALGGVDLLVHNAGVVEHAELPFAEDDVEDTWRVIEVNVRGPLMLTHALLPGMLAAGGARIVHLNSGAGHKASPSMTGYGISKGALARLTTLLDAQYRERGILVFDLAPGVVRTDMTSSMPMHDSRTDWTPVEDVAAMLVAIGSGALDALAGRFVHAGLDTVDGLREATGTILSSDARRLRLALWGQDDPLG